MREKPKNPKKRPLLYRINHFLFDKYDGVISSPIDDYILRPLGRVKWWILYRTTHRYHVVKPDTIEPGYHDGTTLMLPVMMQLVADYVEIELASMEMCWEDKFDNSHWDWKKKLQYFIRYKIPVFRRIVGPIRDRVLGLRYNEFYETYEDENLGEEWCKSRQEEAKTIREIYEWWRDVYPNRPDPMDASGWSEWCDRKRKDGSGDLLDRSVPCAWNEYGEPTLYEIMKESDPEKKAEEKRILQKTWEIEEQYAKEEDEMMKKVISIHRRLWT